MMNTPRLLSPIDPFDGLQEEPGATPGGDVTLQEEPGATPEGDVTLQEEPENSPGGDETLQEEPGDPPGSDGTLREEPGDPTAGDRAGAMCICVHEAFDRWLPHAWVTARGLGSLALALFLGAVVVGIVEEKDTLWICCLAVVVFLFVLGVCAVAIGYRFPRHDETCGEQRQRRGHQGMPVDDVDAMA